MPRPLASSLEILESRIAPAGIVNPIPDLVAGVGKTSATIDLGNLVDATVAGPYHTRVTFHTNFDSSPDPGIQGDITIELFDDVAPLTVQNFIAYATSGGFTGSFFHRLVEQGSSGINILQGGGFKTNFQGVPHKPAVHNEFDLSNLRGTVALAKMAGDPNSGTSDFYFNLSDNTSLDTQNGGFTVFGQLDAASLAVVDAIAALTPQNLTPGKTSAFNTVPVQGGYNPDPDGNASTPPPAPTPAQLIKFNSVQVDPPLPGNGTGYSFAVQSVLDSTTHQPSNLLTTKLTGENLTLNYRPGAFGQADVSVLVTNLSDNSTQTDTFSVTVKPNLAITVNDPFHGVVVPGDVGTSAVKITNNGAATVHTQVDVKVFFLNDTTGEAAQAVYSMLNVPVNLASGASTTLAAKLQLPAKLASGNGENVRLITQVIPSANTPVDELFTDDNFAGTGDFLLNRFGNLVNNSGVLVRPNVAMTYLDASNHLVKLTLAGGGLASGQVVVDANGAAPQLVLQQVSGASVATATVTGFAHTSFSSIFVAQPTDPNAAHSAMGTLNFGSVDLTGDFIAGGGLKSLTLGNLQSTDGSTHVLEIDTFTESPTQLAKVTLGTVTDYNFISQQPISTLTVNDWQNSNATAERLGAYFITSFVSKGDFEAARFSLLGSGTLQTFSVAGVLRNSIVEVGGNVGAVTVGGMVSSEFLAGVSSTPSNSFLAPRTISSFAVKGAASLFSNSEVIATRLGSVSLTTVTDGGATGVFGLVARSVGHYQRGSLVLNNLTAPGLYDQVGDYTLQLV